MIHYALLLALVVQGQTGTTSHDAATIAWKPKAGSVAKYKLTSNTNVAGQNADFSAVLTIKVDSVAPDKIVTTTSTGTLTLSVGGQDMSEMMAGAASSVKITYSPAGEILDRILVTGAAEFDNPKIDNAFTVIYPTAPVNIGDSWVREIKSDAKGKISACKTTFTYLGREKLDGKIDAFKIKFDFKELEGAAPMTATGTLWLSAADGSSLKNEYAAKNVDIGQGTPVEMTGKVIRLETAGG